MELEFTKEGEVYVAETTVNNDYALHIERNGVGKFLIEQRHAESGKWCACIIPSFLQYNSGEVIDWSFGHGVYPCHVRITSGAEVTTAEIMENAQ